MPTRKPVELIEMARQLGWPERELTRKEMMHIKTLHKANDQRRLKQVMKDVKIGNYEPILLTNDDPPILIDGHMRLKACKKLRIAVKAIFTKYTREQIDEVQKLRDQGIFQPVFE